MSRMRWIARMDESGFRLIPADEYVPPVRTQILTDTIPETWHPVTGEHYTSRTQMIKVAKAAGLEELGNERVKTQKPRVQRDPENIERLSQAYDQAIRNNR